MPMDYIELKIFMACKILATQPNMSYWEFLVPLACSAHICYGQSKSEKYLCTKLPDRELMGMLGSLGLPCLNLLRAKKMKEVLVCFSPKVRSIWLLAR
jgi:hypothetical protein